jgi:uncharacterized membrane protein YtjA (UPF0391 family)
VADFHWIRESRSGPWHSHCYSSFAGKQPVEAHDAEDESPFSSLNPAHPPVGGPMLRYAAIFFVIAIIAAVFGFGGVAAGAAEIAKVLFFIFVVIFLVTLLMGLIRR